MKTENCTPRPKPPGPNARAGEGAARSANPNRAQLDAAFSRAISLILAFCEATCSRRDQWTTVRTFLLNRLNDLKRDVLAQMEGEEQ